MCHRTYLVSLTPPGLDSRTVQALAGRYADYAIPAHTLFKTKMNRRHIQFQFVPLIKHRVITLERLIVERCIKICVLMMTIRKTNTQCGQNAESVVLYMA